MAVLASVAFYVAAPDSIRLTTESIGWPTLVRGGARPGERAQRTVILLPGVNRLRPGRLFLQWTEGNLNLSVSVDRRPGFMARSSRDGAVALALPEARVPGVRLDITSFAGEQRADPPRLASISIDHARESSLLGSVLAFLLVGSLVLVLLGREQAGFALAQGFFAAGLLSLAATGALVHLALPEPRATVRLAVPVVLMLAGWASARKQRQRFFWAAGILSAVVVGAWIRVFFLPSPGSWDTEYWKAWTARANAHGVTRVYGDPGSVPEGQLWNQLRHPEKAWTLTHRGREFGVDYPPLAMALWRASSLFVSQAVRIVDVGEKENVAAKLPAVLGDVAAVLLLLWAHRQNLSHALALSACYWVLPLSWLSSAVLGFQDGAYAPLAAAGLLAAGSGRAFASGVLLALAFWVKPLALVVFPLAALGLLAGENSSNLVLMVKRLVRAAIGGLVISAMVLAPFALDGTLEEALVHLYHAFRPGNLSSGFANPWWVLGHLEAVAHGEATLNDRVAFVRLETASFPAAPMGTALVALSVLWILWRRRNHAGPQAIAFTAAAAFFAFVMLSTGVYENHPHLTYLLLFFGGLLTRRLRFLAAIASFAYVVNLLAFSGLGRFYGQRFLLLEPLVDALSGLRMAPGFDLTLPLAIMNLFVFAGLLLLSRKYHTT